MHEGRPIATVIVPLLNPGPALAWLVERLLAQVLDARFEVLLLDSDSTDGTECLEFRDDRVRRVAVTRAQFRHGATRNYGRSLARGEYVVFLTQDAMPANEFWLGRFLRFMGERPEVVGAFGNQIPYDSSAIWVRREVLDHFKFLMSRPQVLCREWLAGADPEAPGNQHLHFFSNVNSCIRAEYLALHPFPDVDFAEDQVWAIGVIARGEALGFVDDATVIHSHDYGPLDSMRRGFDEGRALQTLLNVTAVLGWSELRSQLGARMRRNWWLAGSSDRRLCRVWSRMMVVSYGLLCEAGKLLGLWLGGRVASGRHASLLRCLSLQESRRRH